MHSLVVKQHSLSHLSLCYVTPLCMCTVGGAELARGQDFCWLYGPLSVFALFMCLLRHLCRVALEVTERDIAESARWDKKHQQIHLPLQICLQPAIVTSSWLTMTTYLHNTNNLMIIKTVQIKTVNEERCLENLQMKIKLKCVTVLIHAEVSNASNLKSFGSTELCSIVMQNTSL